jgi:hypothetical protein
MFAARYADNDTLKKKPMSCIKMTESEVLATKHISAIYK